MSRDSSARKRAFFRAYDRHGNISLAMREAGVGSRATAYKWLTARQREGLDWIDRPPQPTRRVDPRIADAVLQLSESHPGWGKHRLAREISNRLGDKAVSASGVQSVLREAGLWIPPSWPPVLEEQPLDSDWLATVSQCGIQLDIYGQPRQAAEILRHDLWHYLRHRREDAHRTLQIPEAGSWILRGLLQYAHALIDIGRWRTALTVLLFLDDWLAQDASRPSVAQAAFQDGGRRYIERSGTIWHVSSIIPAPPLLRTLESVSLRTDDIWLETQQYLAVVVRDDRVLESIERLSQVARQLDRPLKRRVTDSNREIYQGIINHDLAVVMLQAGWSTYDIHHTIERALQHLLPNGLTGMAAATRIRQAQAYLREGIRQQLPLAIAERQAFEALDLASCLATQEGATILRANVDVGVTETLLQLRPADFADRDRVAWVAELAIEQRLVHRARTLLENPALEPLLLDYVADLEALL